MGVLGASSATLTSELSAPTGLLSAMAFSPNGRYLATATKDLQVTIWSLDSQKVIRSYTAEALPTSFSWHPHKDVLAWTDMQGQLVRWNAVIGSHLPNGFEEVAVPLQMEKGHEATLESDLDDLFDDGLADVAEDLSVSRPKHVRPSISEQGLSQPTFQPGSTPMVSQRCYLSVSPLGTLTCIDQDTHQTVAFDSYDTLARRNFRFTDHYGYNMASIAPQGILFACPAESNSPSSVFYRPFDDVPGIQSEWTVSLPAGENTVALALGGIPNVGSHADMLEGPQGLVDESFTSYATAVVATTRGYLRFFGPSGMQRYVWALGSSVVTLAAGTHGVLVVYRAGHLHGSHVHLAYMLIELSQLSVMQQGPLPLPQETTLTWAGFNELGVPAVFDSEGVLYALDRAWRPGQGRWVPVLDCQVALQPQTASTDPSEPAAPRARCWPIGFTSTHLLGLLLPLSQRFPLAAGPHPLVQELELSICMAQRDGASAPLEEQALRESLLAAAIRDARAATGAEMKLSQRARADTDPAAFDMEADKALLQLVQLACKADRYGRALDAARCLHSEPTLEAALKIAHFFHLPSLADRMEQIRAPLAVRQQFAPELTERACGTDALLRNVARVRVPEVPLAEPPAQCAALDELQKDRFEPRGQRSSSTSVLAQEGLAHLQAPDTEPSSSMTPSDWSLPPLSGTDARSEAGSSLPSAPTRSNPFARTQSIAKERHLQKSSSFFERVEAPKRRLDDEQTDRSEKRSASRQSSLASFAFKGPGDSTDS
ncbi:DNA polymerase alpha accessory factor Mcl1 [Malassezia nana]|uniref:DNA polymerase alpha accessory factor Mcl1 n=1 Tax=Malassezia nana TaxID=180528 RepID=A0AAF0EKY7_9BASI|nr:DNA polymerase alpha accessory factor Mcl1 [Malassezia nana]